MKNLTLLLALTMLLGFTTRRPETDKSGNENINAFMPRVMTIGFPPPPACPNGPGLDVTTTCDGGPDVCTDEAMLTSAELCYFNWPRDSNGCLIPQSN